MKRGWYRMHRGWMDSADFKPEPFTDREAYQWSIEQAAFEPHIQWFNGTAYNVDRGEFVTSIHAIGKAAQWPDKRVRHFISRMAKAGKWAKRGAHLGAKAPTVLVVQNYAKFQTRQDDEGVAEGAPKGERGAKQGQSKGKEQKELKGRDKEGEEDSSLGAAAPRTPNRPYAEMVAMWTEAANRFGPTAWKPKVPELTSARRKALAQIYDVHGLDGWRGAIQRALDSEFLGGPDPPGWFGFKFVCHPEKFVNLMEGNYDCKFSQDRTAKPNSGWGDANAAIGGSFQSAGGSQPLALADQSGARA